MPALKSFICVVLVMSLAGCVSTMAPYKEIENKQVDLGYLETKLSESRYKLFVRSGRAGVVVGSRAAMNLWGKRAADLCGGKVAEKTIYRADTISAAYGNTQKYEVEGFVECEK